MTHNFFETVSSVAANMPARPYGHSVSLETSPDDDTFVGLKLPYHTEGLRVPIDYGISKGIS